MPTKTAIAANQAHPNQAQAAPAKAGAASSMRATPIDCVEFDAVLAEFLRRDQLPPSAHTHLEECPNCSAVLSDFEAIAERVRQLDAAEPEPVPDLWPEIRDTLRREGIIHAAAGSCPPAAPRLVKR